MAVKLNPSKNIPTAASGSEGWIQWHKSLRKTFGKKKANEIWVYAWGLRGGEDAAANDSTLRDYMERQGVDVKTTTLGEWGDSVGDFFGGIGGFFKWTFIILGGVVVVGGLMFVYNTTKK